MINQNSETKQASKVLWIVMGLNALVASLKIIVGTIAGSASIIADGFHSMSDASGNIVGLIGLSVAGKPEDEGHPYGHKKFETISSLMIGFLLLVVGFKAAYGGVLSLINPKTPEIDYLSFAVMALTLLVNYFVVKYESNQGKMLGSDVLLSDSEHTKSDVFITSGVIVGMLLMRFGFPPQIDGLVTLVVSGFIFHASYEILKAASEVLADAAALDPEAIKTVVMACDGVKDCHKIRSRGRQDDLYIDLHVHVDGEMTVMFAHGLEHEIGRKLKAEFGEGVNVIVHIEPFSQ